MKAARREETRMSFVRLSGLVAMLGSVLGIVLTPVLTYLWATYSDVYGYFGRAYFLVFLGCMAGVAGLYTLRRSTPGWQAPDNLEREIVGMTFVGVFAVVRPGWCTTGVQTGLRRPAGRGRSPRR